jgi:23S rRNA G2445 N2-methylase RlmL
MIDEIITMNTSADPGFLAEFNSEDLSAYMEKLRRAIREEADAPARKRQYSPWAHRQDNDGEFVAVAPAIEHKAAATVVLDTPAFQPADDDQLPCSEPIDHPTLFDLG